MITDRTQADVSGIDKDSTDVSKGAYNYTDLNRVEEKVKELNELLIEYNYMSTPILTTKLDWTLTDKFNQNDSARYLSNVQKIRQSIGILPTTPNVPGTMNNLTFEQANNIEKILVDIEMLIDGMRNYFVYSGVSNSGQARLWQNRFRHLFKGYTLINYLESTGTQYIFTGIVPNTNTCTEIKARFPTLYTSGNANWVCFTYLDKSPYRYAVMSQDYSGTPFIRLSDDK